MVVNTKSGFFATRLSRVTKALATSPSQTRYINAGGCAISEVSKQVMVGKGLYVHIVFTKRGAQLTDARIAQSVACSGSFGLANRKGSNSYTDDIPRKMSRAARKPVFGVSDQVLHKAGCPTTKEGYRLENFGLRKKRGCTMYAAKIKALISCAVTAQLICAFVFAYAKSRFSHDATEFTIIIIVRNTRFISIVRPRR